MGQAWVHAVERKADHFDLKAVPMTCVDLVEVQEESRPAVFD